MYKSVYEQYGQISIVVCVAAATYGPLTTALEPWTWFAPMNPYMTL